LSPRQFGPVIFLALIIFVVGYLIAKKPYEAFHSSKKKNIAKWIFFSMLAYLPLSIGGLILWWKKGDAPVNFFLGLIFVIFFTFLTLVVFFLASDIISGIRKLSRYYITGTSPQLANPGRRRMVRQMGIGLAVIPFFSFFYGITKGKYDFTVRKVKLRFPDLPDAFNGFRFTQISDVHSGSFDDIAKVKAGIAMIQQQSPEMMLFTGDFVNERANEADPFLPFFNALHAPLGKFAVLGNHDYGFGRTFLTQEDLDQNHQAVRKQYANAGFRLLNNESIKIEKDGASIRLIGVENWGKPPFPQHGDLTLATKDVDDSEFKILMSHDPTHWDEHVQSFEKLIHLTLSGHTHGLQMGIDIPWLKLSFAKLVYPHWIDLYREGKKYLYVNRGFGWLGMPARVGVFPEITVFELEKG
jgi:predicted MPP superfamily phosphohydrolase